MSQAEIQITDTPPLPGVQLVQELNDAFEALATDFSGSVDPAAYAFAYSLWADTGTGNLKRRNAGNSAWVVVGKVFPSASDLNPETGFKNRIINGNFGINQRGVSGTVTLAAGAYGHDRFKAGASGCTYTFSTSENVTTLTISAGSLIQVIEGLNLQSGDYVLSWQGTAQGKIGGGSYGATGLTGAVTGGANLNIEFNTGTLRLVQFEKNNVATPFEFRSIGQELALCQRYYAANSGYRMLGVFGTGVAQAEYITFPAYMRAAPTVTVTPSSFQNVGFNSAGTTYAYADGFKYTFNTSSAINSNGVGILTWTASAEL